MEPEVSAPGLLYLSAAEVYELLPVGECIGLMDQVLRDLALGAGVQPLRSVMRLQPAAAPGPASGAAAAPGAAGGGTAAAAGGAAGLLGMMPGQLSEGISGIKVITVFPGNHERGHESHLGAVLLFENDLGRPIAHLDASAVTAVRTAAVSGLATRALARAEAGDLTLLGCGVQARWHLAALRAVRPIRRVRVFSRRPQSARQFAAEESRRHGLPVEVAPSAAAAVAGADLVCTVTSARQPVLAGADLAPGAHVNAVGACTPAARELDSAAVARARLYVDRRESALAESGDFLTPLSEGAIGPDHIRAELGDVLLGRAPGRGTAAEITLFKSLGLAVEDLAAALHVYRKALAQGRGVRLA